MKNRFRLFIIGLIAIIFALCVLTKSKAQKRSGFFSHSTPAHKQGKFKDCNACHMLPTANWKSSRRDKQEPFPDVISFPYEKHRTCNGCHSSGAKPDIYSNGGAFCGSCHVAASMRATGGRGVLPFPVKSRPRQFTTFFPHNIHQDIIALNDKKAGVAVAHFQLASFTRTLDDEPQFNNCAICHATRTELPKFEARIPAGMKPLGDTVADTAGAGFPPAAGFFKDKPNSHASCFTCHFQGTKPVGTDCASCHKLTTPYTESAVVKRFSLKFDHVQEDHANADCITCHIRIPQNSDLKTLIGADVPFVACMSCHTPHRVDFTNELDNREQSVADKKPPFQCSYCHTSAIGRFPVPPSHQIR